MTQIPYQRTQAVAYAQHWAFSRNPRYYNFDGNGGDCTNFISQCIFSGCGIMNYKRDIGWYYNSPSDRAAAWSGVPYLYRFLTSNKSVGPFADQIDAHALELGDIIQLGNASGTWYHSLLVVNFSDGDPLVSTHTYDAFDRPLSSYTYDRARFLRIIGARK